MTIEEFLVSVKFWFCSGLKIWTDGDWLQLSIGQGVEQSNFKAYIWYSVARASNYPSEIDSVQKALTPQALAQAQAQATRCFESNYQDCD